MHPVSSEIDLFPTVHSSYRLIILMWRLCNRIMPERWGGYESVREAYAVILLCVAVMCAHICVLVCSYAFVRVSYY